MGRCSLCGKESELISSVLSLCLDCIRKDFKKVKNIILSVHYDVRKRFNLPDKAGDVGGLVCNLCANNCRIPEGGRGYCGLRKNTNGRLVGPDKKANLDFYFDSLPTNCVASWVCPAKTDCGYPVFSYTKGPEYGYKNLAVFYNGCSFNCLFCQNWQYHLRLNRKENLVDSSFLANQVDELTSCICYFGGDPSCQIIHSLKTSYLALQNKKNRILRVCWETNGSMNPTLLDKVIDIALESGGSVKFDLKAHSEEVHFALCGVSGLATKNNFARAARRFKERKEPPLVIASTLLVPGYIDEFEIKGIASFIASLDSDIPYALLGFGPCFCMNDLPFISKRFAFCMHQIAISEGLKNVTIENTHILSEDG